MKRIKLIIASLLILIGMVLTSEGYTLKLFYLTGELYHSTLIIDPALETESIISHLEHASVESQIPIVIYYQSTIDNQTNHTFYTTHKDPVELENYLGIASKTTKSLLSNEVNVNILPLVEVNDLSVNQIIYSTESLLNLNNYLDYGMMMRDAYDPANYGNITLALQILWGIIIIAILMLSLFEKKTIQKEFLIALTIGEDPKQYISKKVLIDTLVFLVVFGFGFLSLNVVYALDVLLVSMGLLITLNALIFYLLNKIQIKEAFSNTQTVVSVIRTNQVIYIVIICLFVTIFTAGILTYRETKQYIKQQALFRQFEGYSLVEMGYDFSIDDTDYQRQINLSKGLYFNLYHRLERSHKVQILAQLFPFDQETQFVFYDHHAFERLIREMGFKPYKKATTFYVPERYPINESLRQQLGGVVNYIDFDIISYSGSHEILYFDQNHEIDKWHVTTNPIILVSNRPEVGHISLRDIQFDITNDQLKVYLDEVEANSEIPINRERISIIGIMSQFEQQTQARQGLFAILMVLGIVLLGLTILLLQVIVGLVYRINRIELATQKILGYQFLEMNQKLLIFLMIANVITMIFIFFLNWLFGLSILPQVVLLSIVIQFIVFIFNAQKNYRESVVTTLKGEL